MGWVLCVSVVLAVAFARPALAQQRGTTDGFHFGPGLASTGFDTGVSTAGTSILSDQVVSIVPGSVSYNKPFRRTNVNFRYEPRIELYTTLTELNALNHSAQGGFTTQLSRDLSLEIDGNLYRSKDASLQMQTVRLSPRGRFMRGQVNVGTTYQINPRTDIQFRVAESYTESPALTTTELISVTQLASTAIVAISRDLGRENTFQIRYAYQTSTILNADELLEITGTERTAPVPRDTVQASFTRRSRSGFTLSGQFGLIRRRNEVIDSEYSYTLGAAVQKAWRWLDLNGSYQRTLGGFFIFTAVDPEGQPTDPLLQSRLAQNARAAIVANLGRRIQLNSGFNYTRTDVGGNPLQFLNENVSVTVRVSNRFAPFVNISYLAQFTPNAPTFTRGRILAGLRFFWEPTRIGTPLDGRAGSGRPTRPVSR